MNNLFENLASKPFFILGPCVMESLEIMEEIAESLVQIKKKLGIEIIFKSSFDKANRTSIESFRGPGLEKGMDWLLQIKKKYQLPVTTDIHESYQAKKVGEVVDIIQIPAFLCRQTDLVVEAAKTGKIVNIKKAQFLSAQDMKFPAEKVLAYDNKQIMLTERGNLMGYNNLVVDFRNIQELKKFGYPVVMDCTHSVQKPGGMTTGGNREYVRFMALAAKVFGANGYFLEVHPNPDKGLSDAANMYQLSKLEALLEELV